MNSVVVRGVQIGEGIPKICVPIIENSQDNIMEAAKLIINSPADLIEWRADWFDDVFDFDKVENVLKNLRQVLGDTPILFTFRTKEEGGEKAIGSEKYLELNKKVVDSGCADLIDIELFQDESVVSELIAYAHAAGTKVLASNHDFQETPEEEDIVLRLRKMQERGADILKIAVMPNSSRDVITLLSATEKMVREYAAQPVVTIAMSKWGVISRISGEMFGSAISFGTVGNASAPGQISVCELKKILELMHE